MILNKILPVLLLVTVLSVQAQTNPSSSRSGNKKRNVKISAGQVTAAEAPARGSSEAPGGQRPQNGPAGQPARGEGVTQASAATSRNPSAILSPEQWKQLEQMSRPVVDEKPNGAINWTDQYVEARGEAVIDYEKYPNSAQARLMARRGAVVVAQRNLLEIIKGVHVTGETTVQDMMTTRDYIYSRVEGIVKGAQQVGEPMEKDGVMEVRLRMPLYEARNSLGAALYPELNSMQARMSGGVASAVNTEANASGEMKARRSEAGQGNTNPESSQGTSVSGRLEDYNPFVFNIRNPQNFDPSLFPVILDENGQVVLDFSKIYDPQKGKFPQLLSLSKDAMQAFGWKEGEQVVDLIASGKGKLQVAPGQKGKINWNKVLNTISDIGRFILRLL